jgi:tetratricopeptide (TPR) repeat protein
MTFRDEEAKTSPFLIEMRDRWPHAAVTHDVAVGPLNAEDARKLATTLLDANDELAQRTARAVARESRGSPFLIEELIRSNRGVASASGATLAVLTLEQMVSERLDRLPEQARQLIEILAVSGRPLPLSVVASVSGAEGGVHEVMSLLSARRFARTGLRDGREVVETTHDRIRETIVTLLPVSVVRDHHRRLARVLEEIPGADAEAIAVHWLGAGDLQRAARFAQDAAEQAATKLAFAQAARLYRLAIDSATASPQDARLMLPRFAEILKLAGRFEESARAYLEAALEAPADQKLEFQCAAAQQMLSGGRLDEGTEMLRGVLVAVGMRAPRSPVAAVFWLVVYRLWLAVIGLRFKERLPEDVSREDRLRIEALFTVSIGFSVVNVILSACMQTRHLIEALRRGDRFQVMRAAALSAAHLASMGKPRGNQERALVRIARDLAKRDGTLEATTHYAGALGVGLFQRGRWKNSLALLDRADKVALYSHPGFSNVRLFAIYAGFFGGEISENTRRLRSVFADAEERRDRYTTVNLGTSVNIHALLATNDPAAARRSMDEALAQWPVAGFHVQHWQAMVYSPSGGALRAIHGDDAEAQEELPSPRRFHSLLHALHAGAPRHRVDRNPPRHAIYSRRGSHAPRQAARTRMRPLDRGSRRDDPSVRRERHRKSGCGDCVAPIGRRADRGNGHNRLRQPRPLPSRTAPLRRRGGSARADGERDNGCARNPCS